MFIDDKEKMRDFHELSKDDFLASYSYLTEKEYDDTRKALKEEEKEYCVNFNDKRIKPKKINGASMEEAILNAKNLYGYGFAVSEAV